MIERVKLIPRGAFHLGERGIGLEETAEIIHSDTLFSAFCHAFLLLYGEGELTLLLQRFREGDPPFLITSAFPYLEFKDLYDLFFFPCPRLWRDEGSKKEKRSVGDRKFAKKAIYVSKKVFTRLISGEEVEPPKGGEKELLSGKCWLSEEECENLKRELNEVRFLNEFSFFKEEEVPRVTLDRVQGRANIFYFSRIRFHQSPSRSAGYFFLIRYLDEKVRGKFQSALRLLGDMGIGGDRSGGNGQFTPSFEEDNLPSPSSPSHFVTLSLYYPKREEIKEGLIGDEASYELILRDGWIYSPRLKKGLRRKGVRMFTEGSVLVDIGRDEMGVLVDVSPEVGDNALSHPVYRYGFAFKIGVEIK